MSMKAIDFESFSAACPFMDTSNGYACELPDNEVGCCCSACPLGFSAEKEDLKSNNISWVDEKPDEIYEDEYIVITNEERKEIREALDAYEKYLHRYE